MEFFKIWQYSTSLLIVVILNLVVLFYWFLKFQKQLNLRWKEALTIAVLQIVVGLVSMRLMAIIEVGGNMKEAANMRIFGGIFALLVMYLLWAKRTERDPKLVMDVAAICTISGAIGGRLNCLISGCCDGIPVFFYPEMRWPLREVELVYYAIFVLTYARRIIRRKTHGQVYPIYLMSYGILRFFSEFVREEFTGQLGNFHLAHIWSLISVAIGAVMYYKVQKNVQHGKAGRNKAKSPQNGKRRKK